MEACSGYVYLLPPPLAQHYGENVDRLKASASSGAAWTVTTNRSIAEGRGVSWSSVLRQATVNPDLALEPLPAHAYTHEPRAGPVTRQPLRVRMLSNTEVLDGLRQTMHATKPSARPSTPSTASPLHGSPKEFSDDFDPALVVIVLFSGLGFRV